MSVGALSRSTYSVARGLVGGPEAAERIDVGMELRGGLLGDGADGVVQREVRVFLPRRAR